jgi:hypothetical protein
MTYQKNTKVPGMAVVRARGFYSSLPMLLGLYIWFLVVPG